MRTHRRLLTQRGLGVQTAEAVDANVPDEPPRSSVEPQRSSVSCPPPASRMHPTRYAYVQPRRTTAEMAQVRASRTLPPPPVAKDEDPNEWEHPEGWE